MSNLLPVLPLALVVGYFLLRPAAKPDPTKKSPPRAPVRDFCETVVFVVALVLLLKLFAIEAFVIPTGSMAETLYGYQKNVECPECGHNYTVNSSNEVAPWDGVPRFVTRATCPNCRHTVRWDRTRRPDPAPGNTSGDRVLVHKAMYHVDGGPTRGDVVVFKYPVDPQVNHEAQNYIKRLWGLGGETVAVWRGDLYMTRALKHPADAVDAAGQPLYPRAADPLRQWEGASLGFGSSKVRPPFVPLGTDFTYHTGEASRAALDLFERSRAGGFAGTADDGFVQLRKTDAQALAMRRLVSDNDRRSATLAKANAAPRWQIDGGWDSGTDYTAFTRTGPGLEFVRYTHRVPAAGGWEKFNGEEFPPQPVGNFLGYNTAVEMTDGGFEQGRGAVGEYWVGDLMVEATANVQDPTAAVVLEVARGLCRFRATFQNGEVVLSQTGPGGKELAKRPSGFADGRHRLRFANFDGRLRVWVDGKSLDFGPAADHPPADADGVELAAGALLGGALAVRPDGHTTQNDVAGPAAVGASGKVTLSELKLWQDTYFTPTRPRGFDGPEDAAPLPDTFYVHPGHYLCLGDNSGQSSDGRMWGLVPERLMLGRACFIFFPLDRIGFIR